MGDTMYKTIRLPTKLIDQVDEIVKSSDYSSRAEFVKDAIRRLIENKLEAATHES